MTTSAVRHARAGARRLDRSRIAEAVARAGLAARAVFYLLLAYLAIRIALLPDSASGAANAHGALATVAGTVIGRIAIAVAAAGFAGFALARLSAAVREPDCSRWQRLQTAVQGVFYLGVAYVPLSFLFGNHAAGSERQQQQRTAELLGIPGGQILVVAIGVVVVGICVWQIRSALLDDHRADLDLSGTSAAIKRAVQVIGAIGILARALVFLPIGGFLIAAAVQYDPHEANGLDGELLALSGHAWGVALILLAAAGLLVFAGFAALEAGYRDTTKPA
jgi:uncharacterized protein DUF1206